ncbi:hypothetical protein [Nostoc sp. NIES-3756]|nr:hypothetical protein [Nostoc sp. NIES-3756]
MYESFPLTFFLYSHLGLSSNCTIISTDGASPTGTKLLNAIAIIE